MCTRVIASLRQRRVCVYGGHGDKFFKFKLSDSFYLVNFFPPSVTKYYGAHLHSRIVKDSNFPKKIEQAIKKRINEDFYIVVFYSFIKFNCETVSQTFVIR